VRNNLLPPFLATTRKIPPKNKYSGTSNYGHSN
jgi:hypothetical protein